MAGFQNQTYPMLTEAQYALMKMTGKQISMAEVQRLDDALNCGQTVEVAVRTVYNFFAKHAAAFEYASNFENGKAAQDAYDRYFTM